MSRLILKFNIDEYSASKIYNKYDVVRKIEKGIEYYFVSVQNGHSGMLDDRLYSNEFWKRFDDINFDIADVWTPTYSSNATARNITIDSRLDNGVNLASRDGINNSRLSYSLMFENIENNEAKSLLCYFDFVGIQRSFIWSTPAPYNKKLKFNMVSLTHNFLSKNRNKLTINMEQAFTIFGAGAGQVPTLEEREEFFGRDNLEDYVLGGLTYLNRGIRLDYGSTEFVRYIYGRDNSESYPTGVIYTLSGGYNLANGMVFFNWNGFDNVEDYPVGNISILNKGEMMGDSTWINYPGETRTSGWDSVEDYPVGYITTHDQGVNMGVGYSIIYPGETRTSGWDNVEEYSLGSISILNKGVNLNDSTYLEYITT